MPPQPSSASFFSSCTVTDTFGARRPLVASATAASTASAKAGGVRSPGGTLTQSRVVAVARATTWASSKAATVSCLRPAGLSTVTVPGGSGRSFDAFLYAV